MTMLDRRTLLLGAGGLALAGCTRARGDAPATGRTGRLIEAARAQIGVTRRYDAAYSRLAFPNGDVPRDKGSCADVIVRAYRDAFRADLQALVNADMRRAFGAYPRRWGLAAPDPSIDHRRVPNLQVFLRRQGAALPIPDDASGWRPGDIFTSFVDNRGPHIGLVSDRSGPHGPLIFQNVGAGTREEEGLLAWPITGRFRWSIA